MNRPKLRSEMETADQPDGLIVKDPARNKFYRFTGASALVVKTLDGNIGLDEIPSKLAREANLRISPETVNQFLRHLVDRGLKVCS